MRNPSSVKRASPFALSHPFSRERAKRPAKPSETKRATCRESPNKIERAICLETTKTCKRAKHYEQPSGGKRATSYEVNPMSESDRLYAIYSKWTGELHFWCLEHLGRRLNAEFFLESWQIKLYPGPLQEKNLQAWGFSTVPGFERPRNPATVQLPRPADNPSQADLDAAFRACCLAAAQVLKIDLSKPKLPGAPARPHTGNPPKNELPG